ncbi:NAD(P)/FAD-dependent oxidoreductase [Aerococcus sp. UMB10185]|uniref:NAD(P)/FAD-dependent oxidoreductase n=1 Tax=unclassified Aerococcus TaxID=2618060 RepID=UPI00254F0955|nr:MULTISPECIES: NAD(P)/FAD-dependent oxidoreductase [unclassified Aerococcus]MDK6233065.1 NAD(P)/FAD-dependent oxidoreductase [Aerococcus sp. UMB10185]MDK6855360.1 NAD(P)/FAD-dependent oxidoreductase [Aerococcus sp. UMB7533]
MQIVIIGGSFAGLEAALACREEYPEAEVKLFEAGEDLAFSPNSLREVLTGHLADLSQGTTVSLDQLESQRIDCHLRAPVQAIQVEDRTITYEEGGEVFQQAYDYLVLAMGSQVYPKDLSSDQAQRLIRTKDHATSQQSQTIIKQVDHILVVGGGPIGIEAAVLYRQLGKQVTLIEAGPYLAYKLFDPWLGNRLQDQLIQLGVQVHCQATYQTFEADTSGVQVQTQQATYQTDAVHFAINLAPRTELVQDQLVLNPDGTIWVDAYLRTSAPGVFACGDLVRLPLGPEKSQTYLPLVSHAKQTGRLAALNLEAARYPVPVSQRTEALTLDQKIYFTGGISQTEADYQDLAYCLTRYESDGLAIQIISEQATGKIFGLQACLSDQATSQTVLALMATALQAGLTDYFLSLQANLYQGRQALIDPDWFQAIGQHWRTRRRSLDGEEGDHAD